MVVTLYKLFTARCIKPQIAATRTRQDYVSWLTKQEETFSLIITKWSNPISSCGCQRVVYNIYGFAETVSLKFLLFLLFKMSHCHKDGNTLIVRFLSCNSIMIETLFAQSVSYDLLAFTCRYIFITFFFTLSLPFDIMISSVATKWQNTIKRSIAFLVSPLWRL